MIVLTVNGYVESSTVLLRRSGVGGHSTPSSRGRTATWNVEF